MNAFFAVLFGIIYVRVVTRVTVTTLVEGPMEYNRRAGDLYFPLPCQRPEAALADGSRSSCSVLAHTITAGGEALLHSLD
jgi:hypothetical protein